MGKVFRDTPTLPVPQEATLYMYVRSLYTLYASYMHRHRDGKYSLDMKNWKSGWVTYTLYI